MVWISAINRTFLAWRLFPHRITISPEKEGCATHPDRQPHSSTTNNSVCGRVLATQCRSFTSQKPARPAQFHTLCAKFWNNLRKVIHFPSSIWFRSYVVAQIHTLLAAIRHQSLSSWRDGHRLLCLDAIALIHSLSKELYNYKQCSCEAIWLHARAENKSIVVPTFHDGTYLQTGVSTHIEW